MKAIVLLLSLIFTNSLLAQDTPLWEGLEKTLPLDFLQINKFVSFQKEPMRDMPRAPIAAAVTFNGTRVRSFEEMGKVFDEDFLALLPAGKSISWDHNDQGEEVWNFPLHSQVIHVLYLKNQKRTIFELRVAKKMKANAWSFGVYAPAGDHLKLLTYKGFLPDKFVVETLENGRIDVELKHIDLQSCRNCHFRTTISPQQYQVSSEAGPCEFGPDNTSIKNDWARKYFKLHAHEPFSAAR